VQVSAPVWSSRFPDLGSGTVSGSESSSSSTPQPSTAQVQAWPSSSWMANKAHAGVVKLGGAVVAQHGRGELPGPGQQVRGAGLGQRAAEHIGGGP
jgi:hypothetical protein